MLLDKMASKLSKYNCNQVKIADFDVWNEAIDALAEHLHVDDPDDLQDLLRMGLSGGSLAAGLTGYIGAQRANKATREVEKRLQDLGDQSIKEKVKAVKLLEKHYHPKPLKSERGNQFLTFMRGLFNGKSTKKIPEKISRT